MTTLNSRELLELQVELQREFLRRQNWQINKYTPDTAPDRDQLSFHKSTARFRLGFGGNQSGKSLMASYEVAAWAMGKHRWRKVPEGGKQIYVLSSEYRNLYQGIYRHIRPDANNYNGFGFIPKERIKKVGPLVPGQVPIPTYLEVWTDKRGPDGQREYSTITFISTQGGEEARKRVQSAAVSLVVVDEEIEEKIWKELRVRLLATNGQAIITATLVGGEEWLLDLEEKAKRHDPRVHLVRLNTKSNTHISEEIVKDLVADMTDEEYAIRIEGKSPREYGLIYKNFNSSHIYVPEIEFPNTNGLPPKEWERYFAFDFGYRVAACLWAARSPMGVWYLYREYYPKRTELQEICKHIAKVEGAELVRESAVSYKYVRNDNTEKITQRLIDPNASRMMENGLPGIMAQMAAYYDIPCGPADNGIASGITAVRQFLMVDPVLGTPRCKVANNLLNFMSERRAYRDNPDTSRSNSSSSPDKPIGKRDHLMDCWRYLLSLAYLIEAGISTNPSKFGAGSEERVARQIDKLLLGASEPCQHPYLGSVF